MPNIVCTYSALGFPGLGNHPLSSLCVCVCVWVWVGGCLSLCACVCEFVGAYVCLRVLRVCVCVFSCVRGKRELEMCRGAASRGEGGQGGGKVGVVEDLSSCIGMASTSTPA